MMAVSGTRPTRLLFLLVLLLAAATRFYGLDRLGLWADELWVVMDSNNGSLWEMLRSVYYRDNHPPGYYLLSRMTQNILGSSDFAIRLPSALAGIALVAATFICGKKYTSREAALLAATLVAGSYQAIYFSQEARPNIFVALFSLLSLYYFMNLLLRQGNKQAHYYFFWCWSLLNAYFHYAGLVFCVSLFTIYLGLLCFHPDRQYLRTGIKMFFPVLLCYLPWVPGTYHDLMASGAENWQHTPGSQTLLATFLFLFGPGDLRVYAYLGVFLAAPLYLATAGGMKSWRKTRQNDLGIVACLWLAMVIPVIFFYIKSNISQSAYNHRHFLFAIPLLALLTGNFLTQVLSRHLPGKLFSSVSITMLLIALYQYQENNRGALYTANHFKQDYRESSRQLIDELGTGETPDVIIVSNSRFFNHYLEKFSEGYRSSRMILGSRDQMAALNKLLSSQPADYFYYIEAPPVPAANHMLTETDEIIAESHVPLCRTKFLRTQFIKFNRQLSTRPATIDWEDLPACSP